MGARVKFWIGGLVIVAALGWLAFVAFEESKAYYITVDEFTSRGGDTEGKRFKLAGDVVAGSIDRSRPQLEFVIASPQSSIRVRYAGRDIIPDTFREGSKALVKEPSHPTASSKPRGSRRSALRNTKRSTTGEPPDFVDSMADFGTFSLLLALCLSSTPSLPR